MLVAAAFGVVDVGEKDTITKHMSHHKSSLYDDNAAATSTSIAALSEIGLSRDQVAV